MSGLAGPGARARGLAAAAAAGPVDGRPGGGGRAAGPGSGAVPVWAALALGLVPLVGSAVLPETRARMVVEVRALTLDVVVEGWDRAGVDVRAPEGLTGRVRTERAPSKFEVLEPRSAGPLPAGDHPPIRVRVPRTAEVRLWNRMGSLEVAGTSGGLTARAVEGDVTAREVAGAILLSSVNGDVRLERARGPARLRSVAGAIRGTEIEGDVTAGTTSGAITLDDVRGLGLEATSFSGRVRVHGAPGPGGLYSISSQTGAVSVVLPPGASADISAGTVNGDFRTACPGASSTATGADEQASLRVGEGGARIELTSYDGDITLECEG